MKRKIHALVLAASTLVAMENTAAHQGTVTPQDSVMPQGPKPLSKADILSMIKAGLSDDVIAGSILMNNCDFDVSPSALIALNKAGVSMRVLQAMIEGGVAKHSETLASAPFIPPPSPGTSMMGQPRDTSFVGVPPMNYLAPSMMNGTMNNTPGQMQGFPGMEAQPTVTVVGDNAMPLAGERIQSVQVSSKGTPQGNLSGPSALNQMASAGAQDVTYRLLNGIGGASLSSGVNILSGLLMRKSGTTTYVWALRGKLSSNTATVHLPTFAVNFADIPGVDPDEFEPHIVRLESTKSNWRLLGATKVKDQSSPTNGVGLIHSAFLEHEIDTTKKATAPGHMQVAPVRELPPGEYAVVLRPVSAKKQFSEDAISRNDGEGVLFNLAWSFNVK